MNGASDPRRTGDEVSAIALDAGFRDLSCFNRTLRRRDGDTPSGIRTSASAPPQKKGAAQGGPTRTFGADGRQRE
jgi:hypothetical protein